MTMPTERMLRRLLVAVVGLAGGLLARLVGRPRRWRPAKIVAGATRVGRHPAMVVTVAHDMRAAAEPHHHEEEPGPE